jgi:hypothetical protein
MSYETWIMLFGIATADLFVLVGGLMNISTRLTRIETDLKWIKAGCPKCKNTTKGEQNAN